MKTYPEFYEDCKRTYDPFGEYGAGRIERLTDFVRQYIDLPTGSKVLDIGCRYGISSAALVGAGYDVWALEYDFEPSVGAKEFFATKAQPVHIACGDARKMPFAEKSFAGVALLFNPIPHWNIDDCAAIFAESIRVLDSGGVMVTEFLDMLELQFAGGWKETFIDSLNDNEFLIVTRGFNTATGTVTQKHIDLCTNRHYDTEMHLWSQWLLEYLAKTAGFSQVQTLRQNSPMPRKVLVCKKF